MKRLSAIIVIAFCLIPNTGGGVESDPQDPTQKKSKKADKLITYLAKIGVNSSEVKSLSNYVSSHSEGDNFNISQTDYKGFKLKAQYQMEMPEMDNFQLKLTGDEMPHWEANASTKGVMVNYKLEW